LKLENIYKIGVVSVFTLTTLFRIQVGYINHIKSLNNEIKSYKINNSLLSSSIHYMDITLKQIHDKPIYPWPIMIEDYDRMTSEFGYRQLLNPFTGGTKDSNHTGVDLVGTHHARILAIADGEVIEYYPAPNGYFKGDPVFGGKVVIKHDDGRYSMYAHMDLIYNISEHGKNRFVKKGQVIGRTGNTGMSYGEHLHFELWDENKNPIQSLFYLDDPKVY